MRWYDWILESQANHVKYRSHLCNVKWELSKWSECSYAVCSCSMESGLSVTVVTTRMHSSGMHTAHLLTVSQHVLHKGGGCLPRGGVFPRRGCRPSGVYPSMQWDRPPPCGQTDTYEKITFANFVCGR